MKPIKITGAEIKEFFKDDNYWGEACVEGLLLEIDGKESMEGSGCIEDLNDSSEIKIKDGVVFNFGDDSDAVSFKTFFTRWRKQQTTATVLIRCDKKDLENILKILKENKVKISY